MGRLLTKEELNSLVGQKFGKLTVLSYDHYDNINRKYYYKCKCECGTELLTTRYKLIKGLITSCRCIYRLQEVNDIIGKKFNKLTVLSYDHYDNINHKYYYKCKCDCGKETIVNRLAIINGYTKSCGCIGKIKDKYDIIGKQFDRLTVISYDHEGKNCAHYYKCKCACGKETIVSRHNLLKGYTSSCGCKNLEMLTEINSTHKMSGTKIYNTWNSMKARCYNKNDPAYP